MTSLYELMADGIRAGLEPEDAYTQAVAQVGRDDLAEHFRPIGVQEARDIRRRGARRAENRVFGRGGRRLETTTEPDRIIDARAILLTKTFSVGDRLLTWGSATAEDHEQRAAEQEVRAGDLLLDAERHRKAAKILRENDAETLEDVEDLEDLTDNEAA